MNQARNEKRLRKAVNVSLDSALVEKAKRHGIPLAQVFDAHLCEVVRMAEERAWQEANREAIDAYNERVEREGLFSDQVRRF